MFSQKRSAGGICATFREEDEIAATLLLKDSLQGNTLNLLQITIIQDSLRTMMFCDSQSQW